MFGFVVMGEGVLVVLYSVYGFKCDDISYKLFDDLNFVLLIIMSMCVFDELEDICVM